jgi:Holliday junction resolvase-like predicted endonuclease|tara:strand:- start:410 stop:730 length:321 start_codon:yes stop_codon:yes gene_type:complete
MGRYALEICAKRQGDMSEIKALSFLLDSGFDVFRNESSTGPVDIITLDITRKKVILVDVKTQPPAKTTGIYRIPNKTKIQQNLDVQFLFYDKNTDTFTWEKDIVNE